MWSTHWVNLGVTENQRANSVETQVSVPGRGLTGVACDSTFPWWVKWRLENEDFGWSDTEGLRTACRGLHSWVWNESHKRRWCVIFGYEDGKIRLRTHIRGYFWTPKIDLLSDQEVGTTWLILIAASGHYLSMTDWVLSIQLVLFRRSHAPWGQTGSSAAMLIQKKEDGTAERLAIISQSMWRIMQWCVSDRWLHRHIILV